jgi:hypothetical protein
MAAMEKGPILVDEYEVAARIHNNLVAITVPEQPLLNRLA